MFGSETSAAARGFSVMLKPSTPATELGLRRVRMIQDWQAGEFHMNLKVDDGDLVLTGVDDKSLPEGRYEVRVEIVDLESTNQPEDVDVPFGGTG